MPDPSPAISAVAKFRRRFNPKIIIGIFTAILLSLGLLLIAQGFVDTRDYQQRIKQAIKERTGKDVIITGKVSVSLVPVPTIYIPGLELRDATSKQPTPALTVEMVEVTASFFSVLSGHPQISGIELQKPLLEVIRNEDNTIRWDWLNPGILNAGGSGGGTPVSISVSDGRILYHNENTDKEVIVQDVSASITTGLHPSLKGAFTLYGHKLFFDSSIAGSGTKIVIPEGAMPLDFRLYGDAKNMLQLHGSFDIRGGTPKISGVLTAEMENLLTWITPKTEEKKQLLAQITNQYHAIEEEKVVVPVKFQGDITLDGWKAEISNVKMENAGSTGTGRINVAWEQKTPSIAADMQFSALDFNQWKALAVKTWEADKSELTAAQVYNHNDVATEELLPREMQVALKLDADRLTVGGQVWDKAALTAKLADGVITVDQFNILLPGNSAMSMFGIVSQASTTNELRFEGSVETQGKSLRTLLTIFNDSAANLPETGFSEFYLRSNIFVSTSQIRLSEADVKLDALRLSGGLVAYLDVRPRLEASVKLKDINFDYFRDIWRSNQKSTGKQDFFLKFDKTVNFDWLKKLQTTIDFKISVDHFTFLDRKGDNASFRLFAQAGEFGIYDVRLYYPNDTTEGNFTLDVTGEQPQINVVLNAGEMNSDYFSVSSNAPPAPPAQEKPTASAGAPKAELAAIITNAALAPPPAPAEAGGDKRWSEKLIDMSWMEGFNADLDLSIGALKIGDKKFDNLKFKSKLENNQLTFQGLTFLYWQGKCEVAGTVYGGEVPGLSLGFTVYNAELRDIIKSLTERDNIAGRVSVSGTIATSGVNFRSWVEQAEAKLVMAGRGVKVDGFSLQGVIDAVSVSRTAADVFNNVNLALTRGSTVFSVDGNLNVKNGIIKTPGITLKSGMTSGNLTGEIKLIPWTMALSTLFQFPSLTPETSSETIPTMPVQVAGPIDAPDMKIDTASLEAHISAKIGQK